MSKLERVKMRKIVAGFAVSLDGYVEGPNGGYNWMYKQLDDNYDINEQIYRFDTFGKPITR